MDKLTCPICYAGDVFDFFAISGVPTQDGAMWPTRAAARRAPAGDIRLAHCNTCSYIWNRTHDPGKVTFERYDFSLQQSPLFHRFVEGLSARLIARYRVRGRTVLDIGCGDGHFLRTICSKGKNRGIGVDPGHTPGFDPSSPIRFIRGYFSEQDGGERPDFIACRHVLNAVPDPRGLVALVRRSIGPGEHPVVYFEVPNALHTFGRNVGWNVAYEHKSWFSPASLRHLFESEGFDVLRVQSCWGKEYLSVEAVLPRGRAGSAGRKRGQQPRVDPATLKEFTRRFRRTADRWQKKLEDLSHAGRSAAVWGAGARAVTLLALCKFDGPKPMVVDINVKRQGLHLPLSAHRVESPERLREYHPDYILISNPRYGREIRAAARKLGLRSRFLQL